MARKRTPRGKAACQVFKEEGYEAYLQSPWWQSLKRKRLKGMCKGCGKTSAQCLHHASYKRLGRESTKDTVPLCFNCHSLLHEKLLEKYPGLSRGQSAHHTKTIWNEVFATQKKPPKKRSRPAADKIVPPSRIGKPWKVCKSCYTLVALPKDKHRKTLCWRCQADDLVYPHQLGLSPDGKPVEPSTPNATRRKSVKDDIGRQSPGKTKKAAEPALIKPGVRSGN